MIQHYIEPMIGSLNLDGSETIVSGTFTTYFQDDELLQDIIDAAIELERDIAATAPKAATAVARFMR